MEQAINVVFYIFNKSIDLLFNQVELVDGVYLGWVILTCIIFGIIFSSILNTPYGLIRGAEQRKATSEYRSEIRRYWRENNGK